MRYLMRLVGSFGPVASSSYGPPHMFQCFEELHVFSRIFINDHSRSTNPEDKTYQQHFLIRARLPGRIMLLPGGIDRQHSPKTGDCYKLPPGGASRKKSRTVSESARVKGAEMNTQPRMCKTEHFTWNQLSPARSKEEQSLKAFVRVSISLFNDFISATRCSLQLNLYRSLLSGSKSP